jgi:hypothetical protein
VNTPKKLLLEAVAHCSCNSHLEMSLLYVKAQRGQH